MTDWYASAAQHAMLWVAERLDAGALEEPAALAQALGLLRAAAIDHRYMTVTGHDGKRLMLNELLDRLEAMEAEADGFTAREMNPLARGGPRGAQR